MQQSWYHVTTSAPNVQSYSNVVDQIRLRSEQMDAQGLSSTANAIFAMMVFGLRTNLAGRYKHPRFIDDLVTLRGFETCNMNRHKSANPPD